MAEAFVELGAEGVTHLVENHFEDGYDHVKRVISGRGKGDKKSDKKSDKNSGKTRRYQNQLPSPEREPGGRRSDSLERQSEASERVIRAYESERADPPRRVDPRLEQERRRASEKMSYANGYAPDRAHSAQPPRNRYDDDDDSDYDDRNGRRYRSSGRGYDDRDDRDYHDREVIETERYRGPARPYDARRMDSYGSRASDPYGAGAVAPYKRRSQGDLGTEVSRRSRSRGRHDRYDRDDDDDDRDSRDRSREGWQDKVGEYFDTSLKGLGVGLAGAVVGGLAGRQFNAHDKHKHKNRDVLIGAVIGGLGANAAENRWKDWKEERKEKTREDEDKWEQKWDGHRSRSHNGR